MDKDKDAFIGLKEFVSHMMMAQAKDKLFRHKTTENQSIRSTFYVLNLNTMEVIHIMFKSWHK